jgi:hypothetical protein
MAVPVKANTLRKKNIQRGPNVGSWLKITMANPPQPITINNRDIGKNVVGLGD